MAAPPCRPLRLFVSYSHDSSEHEDRVLALVDWLRAHGLDAWVDQYEPAPPEGWPRWCAAQIREADFVLVVCTEIYERRFRAGSEPGSGLGVAWEGAILTQELYDSGGRNNRLIPVLFPPASQQHIPNILRGMTRYDLGTEEGFWRLYRHLTGQLETAAPPVGTLVPLPPRKRQFAFEPAPRYEDERSRGLTEELEAAYRRHEELTIAGQETRLVREEILRIRRELREGGRLVAGDLLDESRFKLIEPIGLGGFATVWKAYDRKRSEPVAVKVLHGLRAGDLTSRDRFFRGARKMAELQHPGIVRVIEPHRVDGGHHFFVMEYVSGGDLKQAVLAGRLKKAEALAMIPRVGEALTYAHVKGVFHRDVKPANILLDGIHPKLTDFDLVRSFDTTGGTQTQGMLGTFLYSAPEMMSRPAEAGAAADVYSLAMTAIFTLHGEDLPSSFLRKPELYVQSLICPQAVKQVLIRAISVEPSERQKSITEFCRELQQVPIFVSTTLIAPQNTASLPLPPRPARKVSQSPPHIPTTEESTRRLPALRLAQSEIAWWHKLQSAARMLLERGTGVLLLASVALVLLQLSSARISTSTDPGAFGNVLKVVLVERYSPGVSVAIMTSIGICGLFLLFRKSLSRQLQIWRELLQQSWSNWTLARERRKERLEKERTRRRIITKHLQRIVEEKHRREVLEAERLPLSDATFTKPEPVVFGFFASLHQVWKGRADLSSSASERLKRREHAQRKPESWRPFTISIAINVLLILVTGVILASIVGSSWAAGLAENLRVPGEAAPDWWRSTLQILSVLARLLLTLVPPLLVSALMFLFWGFRDLRWENFGADRRQARRYTIRWNVIWTSANIGLSGALLWWSMRTFFPGFLTFDSLRRALSTNGAGLPVLTSDGFWHGLLSVPRVLLVRFPPHTEAIDDQPLYLLAYFFGLVTSVFLAPLASQLFLATLTGFDFEKVAYIKRRSNYDGVFERIFIGYVGWCVVLAVWSVFT